MGITALGFMAARTLAAGKAQQSLGLMTASFGVGQIVGPLLAGFLSGRLGDFRAPSLMAATALIAAAALSVRTSRTVKRVTSPQTAPDRAGRTARR